MSELFLPDSYTVAKAREEYVNSYVEKASYGPGIGNSVVLGPAGELARSIREHGSNRQADKALYFYLYKAHPWVYACVELIVQTAAQDRHTYPSEDAPHGDASIYGKVKPGKKTSKKAKSQDEDDDGDEADLGTPGSEPKDGVEFLEHFFAEVNDFESFNELLAGIYRDVLISGEAFILKQRMGASVVNGPLGSTSPEDAVAVGADGTGRYTHVSQPSDGKVVCLHRIPSRYTVAVPGVDGYPVKYRQYADGGGFREYAQSDVVFIKLPDPNDPSRGLSPLEALDLSLATDTSAAKYNEAFFRNGAKAGMVFSAQGLSPNEIQRNKEWINNEYVRPENAHRPMLLLGNIQLVRDGNKAQNDMDFLNLRQFTREDICAVYSVPLSKLLMESGSMGQAGKMSDDITFRADTVGPLQTKVYEALNRQLMKKEFPGKPLLVPPRQEKIRLDLLEAAKSLVEVGGTGNEARAILHLPEIDDPVMHKPLFFTPGLRTLDPDDPAPGLNQNKAGVQVGLSDKKGGGSRASTSDAQRPDRTSRRGSGARTAAKVSRGVGRSRIVKAEDDWDEDDWE